MRFSDLVSRMDDETLQDLLGKPVVELLMLLDPGLATPVQLQKVLLELKSPSALLTSNSDRRLLLNLLRPEAAERLALALGVEADGQRLFQTLGETAIRSGSAKEKALFDFFEVTKPEPVVVEESPAKSVASPDYGLFPHQRRAALKVRDRLTAAPRKVILHMPTGAGKTRTAMHIIADHFRLREPATVVWLAHGEELCEQAASEFEKAWHKLGNRDVTVHRFWGGRDIDLDRVSDGFIVAGLSKLYSSLKSNQNIIINLGRKATLVVLDEAHSAIADTYKMLLETLTVQNLDVALLGLTATPGRTWNDVNADMELAKFFRRQKVTLEVEGYANPVDYLISEGYLARPEFESLMYEGGRELSDADVQKIRETFEIPDSVLRNLADDAKRNLRIIQAVEELAKFHRRILVFAATVQHSDLLASALRARGYIANSITSSTPPIDRSRLIDEYRTPSDTTRILCNFGVLTTGFDAPQTSAAVIARPTQSLVLYSQMVGRAIRGKRAGGNETAQIVTIIDRHLPGFADISESFTNWEDVWNH
jgi:superfamily II DNA or RNA helicase